MSYCRFGADSDVYVFEASWGFCCCACILGERGHEPNLPTPADAIAHLDRHVEAGHLVPQYAFDALAAEVEATAEAAKEESKP